MQNHKVQDAAIESLRRDENNLNKTIKGPEESELSFLSSEVQTV